MKTNWKLYKELELIPDEMWEDVLRNARSHQLSSRFRMNKLFTVIGSILTKEPEPDIREKKDVSGTIWWEVYDPLTGRHSCLSSRAEVLAWLEQRYYRKLL